MTPRLPLLALALAVPLVAGCQDTAGPSGDADLEGIADADVFEQFAYTAGFQTGAQFVGQDSSFSFERFRDGLRVGLAGDSAEIAYAVGLQYGLQLRQDTLLNVDPDVFLAGVREALQGGESRLTDEQSQRIQTVIEDSLQLRQLRSQAATNPQAQERLQAIARNAAIADTFLTSAAGRPGARRTASGVVFEVESVGEGPSPTPGDRVAVEYIGRLPNGEVFDQSEGEPAVLSVAGVVPGFREALLDMRVGGQRTVTIPPDQAYGLAGQGPIPPNSALVFEITLVEVLPAAPQGLPPGLFQGQGQ
jgi:FKBP-type peptidyl-prolyl cis-trans isomerase